MKRSLQCLSAAALMLAALVWLCAPAAAQSGGWRRPTPVSDHTKTPSSWFPDLAIGPDGSVHIIWSSGLPGKRPEDAGQDLLMYRDLHDGTWSQVNDIDMPGRGGYTVRNSIIMGHDGKLHLLVRRGLVMSYMHAPWDAAWSVGAWSEPHDINGGSAYFNALATDSQGSLHVLWNEAIPDDPDAAKPACSSCADLFYRRSSDGGVSWSAPINLSKSPDGSVKQQIKVGADDVLHVVWEEGFDWYASSGTPTAGMYRRSRDGGRTWDPAVRFTLPDLVPAPPKATPQPDATPVPTPAPRPDAPRQLTIGLYRNTEPLVVYRGNVTDALYFQTSDDGGSTWSAASVIPGIRARDIHSTDHDDYSMASDGAGNVHLIAAGYLASDSAEDSPLRLLHLVWNGTRWSNPEVVATSDEYPEIAVVTSAEGERLAIFPEWPRAVISGDTLHVTWFTRNERDLFTSDHAAYQVWYSSRTLEGAAVAPLAQFTPVPTALPATPTPEPTVQPTATLSPAVIDAPPIDAAVSWEGPGMLVVAAAGLVTAGLVVAIGGLRLLVARRRRILRSG
jgi:hypothetical protein